MSGRAAPAIGRSLAWPTAHPVDVLIGTQLRAARAAAGIGQAVAARHLAITPSGLGRIERGAVVPTADQLDALARLYRLGGDQRAALVGIISNEGSDQ